MDKYSITNGPSSRIFFPFWNENSNIMISIAEKKKREKKREKEGKRGKHLVKEKREEENFYLHLQPYIYIRDFSTRALSQNSILAKQNNQNVNETSSLSLCGKYLFSRNMVTGLMVKASNKDFIK